MFDPAFTSLLPRGTPAVDCSNFAVDLPLTVDMLVDPSFWVGDAATHRPSRGGACCQPGAGKPKGLDEDRDKLRAGLQESVVAERPKVRWEDVAGLQDAKKALRQVPDNC